MFRASRVVAAFDAKRERRFRNRIAPLLLTVACFLMAGQSQLTAAMILSESVTVDQIAQEATFELEFDTVPDFFTVDAFGRPADSFQYFLFYEGDPFQPDPETDVIIRGDEIHIAGDIRFR